MVRHGPSGERLAGRDFSVDPARDLHPTLQDFRRFMAGHGTGLQTMGTTGVHLGIIRSSASSLVALACAIALAGILVSPAVPSPPTVVGKTIDASVTSLTLAFLPPACGLASILLGMLYLTLEQVVHAGDSAVRPASLPLRR